MKTKTLLSSALAAILSITGASISYAQSLSITNDVPKTISYQGALTDYSGSPLPDGTYKITLSLYADPTGSSKLWQDSYDAALSNGIFNLYLGDGQTPLPDPATMNTPLWVGTQVGDSPLMYPLTPLSASPYALNVPDRAITTGKLADGAVTADKVSMDYVRGITVNGQPITAQGSVLNIEGSEDIALNYDNLTNTLRLSRPMAATEGDQEKSSSVQGTTFDFWTMRGNGRTDGGSPVTPVSGDWIGTSNTVAFEMRANNQRVMYYQPSGTNTPNIVGGYSGNSITAASIGSTIAGGGASGIINSITSDADYVFIGGGTENSASANFAVIGGGDGNTATGTTAVIGGGQTNHASSNGATIAGGTNNTVSGVLSGIAGGIDNTITGQYSSIGGGAANTVSGNYAAIIGGGDYSFPNTVAGNYSLIGTGFDNTVGTGSMSAIVAGGGNYVHDDADQSFIGAGAGNEIYEGFSNFIGAGENNQALANSGHNAIAAGRDNSIGSSYSGIVSGSENSISGDYSIIGGGELNAVTGTHSVVGAGESNTIHSNVTHSAIVAGMDNDIDSNVTYSIIGSGESNQIQSGNTNSVIAGGMINSIAQNSIAGTISGGATNSIASSTFWATIGGGSENLIGTGTQWAVIAGGHGNSITTSHSVIGGGHFNSISAENASLLGGWGNAVTGTNATLGGGISNGAAGEGAFLGGGQDNNANGNYSVAAGGINNLALSPYSTIAGGSLNQTSNNYVSIGGGLSNSAGGLAATIPGGDHLQATSYAQSAVGFFNAPRGFVASQPTTSAKATLNYPLFMVGNGTPAIIGGGVTASNAFEVSYNGHSVVYDVNGSSNVAVFGSRSPIRGATYVDNVVYAWGNVDAAGGVNADFGVASVTRTGPGTYIVRIVQESPLGASIRLNSASITATVVDKGEDPEGICRLISTTDIANNQFTIRTKDLDCHLVDTHFMFKVTGRP